jgi:hypothetical protein
MKKTLLFGLALIIGGIANAQIIDKSGFRVGGGLSNQYWNYHVFTNLTDWKDNRPGLSIYLNSEKTLTNYLSIRPEIGYLQKGFKDAILLSDIYGEIAGILNMDFVFHNLSGNLGFKINPVDFILQPYLIFGIRGNYMFDYKDFEIEYEGVAHGVYKSLFDEFNKFTLSGLIGVGFEYRNFFLDLEYNPAITKIFDETGLSIKDRYYGLTLGLNIFRVTGARHNTD